jgi:DNA-binding response OmpR family regulator
MAEAICRQPPAPIVFLTVHGDEPHRLKALELGAIEYLSKPIHPRELALRIKNLTAQLSSAKAAGAEPRIGAAPATAIRRIGDLLLDLPRRRLGDGRGNEIALTASEFETLALLTAAPHRVVTRQEIAAKLGPQSAARHNARIVDILIWRLRKKLGRGSMIDRLIVTAPSQGYIFVPRGDEERETP